MHPFEDSATFIESQGWQSIEETHYNSSRKRPEEGKGTTVPYTAGVSEKPQRIFKLHNVPVCYISTNTLRQAPVHHKDKLLRDQTKLNNVVHEKSSKPSTNTTDRNPTNTISNSIPKQFSRKQPFTAGLTCEKSSPAPQRTWTTTHPLLNDPETHTQHPLLTLTS